VLPAAGEAAGPGSISGTVTGKGAGPLVGIEVCAFPIGSGEGSECVESGPGGSYLISGLPVGEYEVAFFGSRLNYVLQFYDGAATFEAATPVPVGEGLTSGIDAELEKGAKIRGIVTAAATGAPVANVVVCAESTDGVGYGCSQETGATGAYVVQGLAPGSYEVEFWAGLTEENLLTTYYSGLVSVPAGGEVVGINGALPTGGQVEGTVRTAATGAPLAGVQVCVTGAQAAWVGACVTTPRSGGYRFFAMPTGSYKVVFSPEPSEIEEAEYWEIAADAFPTQWWNSQPTFATATPIGVVAGSTVAGIDGSLGPGPVVAPQPSAPQSPAPPAAAPVKPMPKPLKCKRDFAKKTVKGKARCVRRHKPKRHHRKHHPKPRGHSAASR
jgi:hypothetical protein